MEKNDFYCVRTDHGLKYYLSQNVFNAVAENDSSDNDLFSRINSIVEDAESVSSFMSFISFILLTFFSDNAWYLNLFISSCITLIGIALSYCPPIFLLHFLDALLFVYHNYLCRFFLPYFGVIVVGILTGPWYSGILFLISQVIINFIDKIFISTYQRRKRFNDTIAQMMINKFV